MAHFKLHPGQVSRAVVHRSVEEIWYVLAGQGQMWRKAGATEFSVALSPGLSLVIPRGTSFQFRCDGDVALEVVAVTMPPWPGDDEARCVEGKW
jgi:mannose-6-phosphate isomerase-like protein (cupin superfamily)